MFTQDTQQSLKSSPSTLIEDENLTLRRLPIRNPECKKQSDDSYIYMNKRYYSRSALIRRGWTTEEIVNRLGDADVTTNNPYNTRMTMELFLASDVEVIEEYLAKDVLTIEQVLINGKIATGYKVLVNSLNYAGVYTSDGHGFWFPSKENKNQNCLSTGLIEFFIEAGFSVVPTK